MKRMGSESERGRQDLAKEAERCVENRVKTVKRHKSPAKGCAWTDDFKRQLTCTLKSKGKDEGKGVRPEPEEWKFFSDVNIENIITNSEYFKLKCGNAGTMSFCSGKNGENKWTIDAGYPPDRKPVNATSNNKVKDPLDESKPKKGNAKKQDAQAEGDDLKSSILQNLKLLSQDLVLIQMDIKTIQKLIRSQKQTGNQSKGKKEEEVRNNTAEPATKGTKQDDRIAEEMKENICNVMPLMLDYKDLATPDFDKIVGNLRKLSEAAYQPKIIQTARGAKFEIPRELPISLYSDGMLLRNNDFRKYTDIRAALFLRDIEDGFFPSEIWPEYPCGVPFQVTDKRCEAYNDGNGDPAEKFPGSGQRLGSTFDGSPSFMVYLEPTKPERKRTNSFSAQDYYRNTVRGRAVASAGAVSSAHEEPSVADPAKMLSVRVRISLGKEGYLHVNVMSNEKMSRFQDALFRKLCERYHDDYIKKVDLDKDRNDPSVPDVEVHIYGRKPFRLSENLNLYPHECGITDNCVINITEI